MSSSLGNTQLLVGRAGGYSSNYTADISGSLYCASGCVLAASGGYVGIGTTTPACLLDINASGTNQANLILRSNGTDSQLGLFNGASGARNWYVGSGSSASAAGPNFYIYDATASTTRFAINSSGNVGIGTTSPAYNLDIYNSAANAVPLQLSSPISGGSSQSYLQLTSGTYGARIGAGIIQGTGAFMTFNQGSGSTFSESMRIQGSNVGIGTTNPNSVLQIACNTSTSQTNQPDGGGSHGINLVSPKTGTTPYSMALGVDYTTGVGYINAAGNNIYQPVCLQTRGGNVGIGTTIPDSPLHVNSNNSAQTLHLTQSTPGANNFIQYNTTGYNPWYIGTSSTNVFQIYYGSVGVQLTMNANTWGVYSDMRLKNNINDLKYGLDKIMALRPVEYNWKHVENDTLRFGFIAQDVQNVIPELVSSGIHHSLNTEVLSICTTDIIPFLVKAVQEQNSIIQTQQSQIQELRTENTDLKSRLAAIESRLTAAGF